MHSFFRSKNARTGLPTNSAVIQPMTAPKAPRATGSSQAKKVAHCTQTSSRKVGAILPLPMRLVAAVIKRAPKGAIKRN